MTCQNSYTWTYTKLLTDTKFIKFGVRRQGIRSVVQSIAFSLEEKDRLGALFLDKESLPYNILSKKYQILKMPKFWRDAERHFSIKGFRPVDSKKKVIEKALDIIKKTSGSKETYIWPLYMNCVKKYVNNELSNLNQLLLSEDFEEDYESSTEKIFRCIKEKAPLYNVSDEDVFNFYEIWGFDRVSNFDSILNNDNVDMKLVQNLIQSNCNNAIESINKKIIELKNSQNSKIENLSKILHQAQANIKEIEKEQTSFISTIRKEFQHYDFKKLEHNFERLNERIRHSEKQTPVIETGVMEKIKSQVEGMNKRVKELEKRISNLNPSKENELTDKISNGSIQLTVGEILPKWKRVWDLSHSSNISSGALLIIISLLRRANIFVTDSPQILINLLNELPEVEIKNIVASPLWLLEKHLTEDVQFLEKSSSKLKILIISDFDVGIQEVYLIPVLLKWLNSTNSSNSKIFLVPSESECCQVNPRIFEFAITLNFDLYTTNKIIELGELIEAKHNSLQILKETLPKALILKKYTNLTYEEDISKIVNIEVLPRRVLSNYVNVQDGFKELLDDYKGINLPAHFAIYSWLKANKGENLRMITEERIKTIYEGGLNED